MLKNVRKCEKSALPAHDTSKILCDLRIVEAANLRPKAEDLLEEFVLILLVTDVAEVFSCALAES